MTLLLAPRGRPRRGAEDPLQQGGARPGGRRGKGVRQPAAPRRGVRRPPPEAPLRIPPGQDCQVDKNRGCPIANLATLDISLQVPVPLLAEPEAVHPAARPVGPAPPARQPHPQLLGRGGKG